MSEQPKRRPCILIFALLALGSEGGLAASRSQVTQQQPEKRTKEKIAAANAPHGAKPKRMFATPESCGKCHTRIYDSWNRGMHRLSYEDPIFQAAYGVAYLETSGEAAKLCLRCHAPAAHAAGDLGVKDPFHRKGVQCAFCHTVDTVEVGETTKAFTLYQSETLGAPRAPDYVTEAHGVKHQPLLNSPEFCAGCHEYVVPGGAAIMSTWSEWKDSPYPKEGKTCQSCHMPTMGWIVDEQGKMRRINEHDLSRGRTSQKVIESADLRIKKIRRVEDKMTVEVEVENVGSGHCLPTGMPSRRLTMEVTLHSGDRVVDQDFRVYRKVVADSAGRELTTDSDIKLKGSMIISDNRLRPRKPRLETFTFTVDPRQRYKVRTVLNYSYSPLLLKKQVMKINIKELWR